MKVNVLELFSGIGGMHYALRQAQKTGLDLDYEVVAAIDISDIANRVYRHNFTKVNQKSSNICGLTAKQLDSWKVEAIFMSPPCQPFTRQGLQKDLKDNRTQPLVHIIKEIIPNVKSLNYILVENVKGFENSDTHEMLIDGLKQSGFHTQEFLISPTHLNIPNSRLRYYLIARKTPFAFPERPVLRQQLEEFLELDALKKFQSEKACLKTFLDSDSSPFDKMRLDEKVLARHADILDIVNADSSNSCCFTKSYGRYAEGTGSVIQESGTLDSVFERAKTTVDEQERVAILRELNLRYFTPSEIARLLGFPVDQKENAFTFPSDYFEKPIHCYRVLGNSLNVTVVAFLTVLLFSKDL